MCVPSSYLKSVSIHALREEGDLSVCAVPPFPCNVSIHALREEGDVKMMRIYLDNSVSIHALREEGDGNGTGTNLYNRAVSIHALREEGDAKWCGGKSPIKRFYPRPPRGGRHSAFSTMHQTF